MKFRLECKNLKKLREHPLDSYRYHSYMTKRVESIPQAVALTDLVSDESE